MNEVETVYLSIFILEDNLRIPSGIYSSFESRSVSNSIFPELTKQQQDYIMIIRMCF